MEVHESNEKFVPVSLVHPDDVRNPWRGRIGREEYMNLPISRDAAVRLIADWNFVFRDGSDPPYRVTIPAGSRVWLYKRGDLMSPNLIGVEVPR